MPHKMHGDMNGESLIGIMQNNSEEYPPFTVIRDKAHKLKISKSSLKDALEELENKLRLVNTYTDTI
jgi:Mn-dependent DtxR family transcriptional regulator